MKRSTNISLPEDLVEAARGMDVNLSLAAEDGIRRAVARAADARWAAENRATIEAWNRYVEEHGSPLDEFRAF